MWAQSLDTVAVQPGLKAGAWQITQQIETLEVPGLPATMVERMARDPRNTAPRSFCLEAGADTPPPPAMFHALGGECAWESWQPAGDQIEAALACKPPGGGPGAAQVRLSGTIDAESFALRSETVGTSDTGEVELKILAQLAGTRLADCDG